MTDLTDKDRRDMLQWARIALDSKGNQEHGPWVTAARYILANVDAPATTLAEELRHIAEHWEEWATETITSAIRAAADRAEQVEKERDEARAEVERLTAANEELRRTDNYREFRDKFLTVQKAAESKAESSDPADVPAGEAWLVECRGERRTAVKDNDAEVPWSTVNANGEYFFEDNEDVTLLARLVPAPRVITNHDGLNRAKRLTVIRDGVGVVCERAALGDGWFTTGHGTDQTPYIQLPVTVLWEPGA